MLIESIAQLFKTKDRFLLLVHHSPDGDTIASSLALGQALRQLRKHVTIVCADPIPLTFHFLPGVRTIQHDFLFGDYDVIVTLDCGDCKRTGFSQRLKDLVLKQKKILVNIDHHPKNDLHTLATYNYVDYAAPATASLVYTVIQELGVALDYKLATCLLTGLYTDTGGFKHANTTPESLSLASHLLSYGARLKDITYHISPLSSVTRLKLWGVALSRIYHHQNYDIVSTFLTTQDLEAIGAGEHDISGIVSLLSTIPSQITILVIEMPNNCVQVRMRTKNKKINLTKLANYLGGGGQRRSAGFAFIGSLSSK